MKLFGVFLKLFSVFFDVLGMFRKQTGGFFSMFRGLVGANALTREALQPALDKMRDHLIGKRYFKFFVWIILMVCVQFRNSQVLRPFCLGDIVFAFSL